MSRIALTPNASGTGTFTIAAPGTNTDRTLTLPDVTTTLVGTDATQTLTNKSIAASQLTGALPAISGSALTNLPDPTSAQVGTATAGLALGAVGTYAFSASTVSAGTVTAGSTYAGSALWYTGYRAAAFINQAFGAGYGSSPTGTWMAMGSPVGNGTSGYYVATLFLRIS